LEVYQTDYPCDLCFNQIIEETNMLDLLLRISIDVIAFLQSQLAILTPIMRIFTFLGDEEFYLLIMPFLVWSVDYTLGMRLGVSLMLSGTINSYFKVAIRQPRPYWVSTEIKNLAAPMGSFGLPSGHSQNAVAVFGLLASAIKNGWARILLVITIIMVAFSRLFLGVHSIADIVLGLVMGAFFLWIFIRVEKRVVDFMAQKRPLVQLLLVFALSLLLLFLGALIIDFYQRIPIPKLWVENFRLAHPSAEMQPFSIEGLITTTATLFGLVAGFILVRSTGGYNASIGKVWQHASRFVIGIAGVVLIWKGLGDLFPRDADCLSHSLRYVRYSLIGVWITGFAPLTFVKAKLAQKKP
jgi:membrane-associated phospholipid phosphatase